MNLECKPVFACKQIWLDCAEVFDSWRVFPRIMVTCYGVLYGWTNWYLVRWYAYLPPVERTVQVTAFVSAVLTALAGLSGWIYKIYSENGRPWHQGDSPETVNNTTVVNK